MDFVWMETIHFYVNLSRLGKFLINHSFPDCFAAKLILRHPHALRELSVLM